MWPERSKEVRELDPRDKTERLEVETSDDASKPDEVVKIGAQLPLSIKTQLVAFLLEFKGVFDTLWVEGNRYVSKL